MDLQLRRQNLDWKKDMKYSQLTRGNSTPKACVRSYYNRSRDTRRWVILLNGAARRKFIRDYERYAELYLNEAGNDVAIALYGERTVNAYKVSLMENGRCQIVANALAKAANLSKTGTDWAIIGVREKKLYFELKPIRAEALI
jgi:hypothetical protein